MARKIKNLNNDEFSGVKFHIESQDYFGTLASVLSLIRDDIDNKDFKKIFVKILGDLKKDLMYLQENYKIENK